MTAIVFNSLFPVSWVIAGSMLILCLLGWLEIKRNQKFLALRLTALLLAVISIACLILNPALSMRMTSDIILLTPNYRQQTLDSIANANPACQIYKLASVPGANNAVPIQNYRDLSKLSGNLFLLGEGLPQYMLEYVDTSSIHHFQAPSPSGFIGIKADKIYSANQRATVEGSVNLRGHWTISLTGPAGKEDSVRIQTKSPQSFSVTFTPKTPGLFAYTLSAADSSGAVRYTEQLPVQVKEQKTLSILFLSDYPSAEIRFLKNFLERKGHQLTLRYRISKEKYRAEFINTPQKNIGLLNKQRLQHFDLLLTDATSLASLSGAEIREAEQAVKEGLGILSVINTSTPSKQTSDFLNLTFTVIKNDSAHLRINQHRVKIPATPVNPSSAKKLFAVQSEISGRMISGYTQNGLGKSGFQILTNTFTLELSGEKNAYAEIWSPLIERLARKEISKYDLRFITPFPYYPDEPLDFTIISASEKPTVRIDSIEIPLVENPLIKNVWFGKTWAGKAGWNTLYTDQNSSRYNFFVSKPEGWRALQAANQVSSIRKLVSEKEKPTEKIIHQPVSRILFFALFLITAGFLWLAPKL